MENKNKIANKNISNTLRIPNKFLEYSPIKNKINVKKFDLSKNALTLKKK